MNSNQVNDIERNNQNDSNKSVRRLLFYGILASAISPILTTLPALTPYLDFSKTGDVGDTIGGVMGTGLNFLGIILLYRSFQQQFDANNLQRRALNEEKERNELSRNFDTLSKLIGEFRETSQVLDNQDRQILGIIGESKAIESDVETYFKNRPEKKSNDEDVRLELEDRLKSYIFSRTFLSDMKYSLRMLRLINIRLQASVLRTDEREILRSELAFTCEKVIDPLLTASRDLKFELNLTKLTPYLVLRSYFGVLPSFW